MRFPGGAGISPAPAAVRAHCPDVFVQALLEGDGHSVAVLGLHGAAFEPDLLIKSADPILRPVSIPELSRPATPPGGGLAKVRLQQVVDVL